MKTDLTYYLERFGMTPALLGRLVAEGLKGGGNWCDLFFEDTAYTDLMLRDGIVSSGGSHIDYGCGIRVLDGERTGYAYAESTEFAALSAAARAAAAIGSGTAVIPAPASAFSAAAGRDSELYPMRQDWRTAEADAFVPALQQLDRLIRSRDSRVRRVTAMLSSQVSEILMYNSLGECTADTRPLGSLTVSVVFEQDGRNETRSASKSFRTGAEMIDESLLQSLADQALAGVDEQFEARRPKGGQMSVVMAAGASGILLHEAMGHTFEADFIRKGQSIFAGRLGQRVARPGIDIYDDGTVPGNRGACAFDDEGIPGQKTCMVEDGILRSYLHDRISAGCFGVAPTGNGRRESFRYHPIPRMRATYMASGRDGSAADLVADVKKGIFVKEFANGEVKIGEGDFTFYVKSGSLIENGRLTSPIKDINIIGNGPQTLQDIVAVGSDLIIDDGTWTCGKEQSVPVSCGIPSVLVRKLTVGGA